MPTAFRTTAILPDASGRYRTSIVLASRLYGEWPDTAIAEHIQRERALPVVALTITDAEYDRMDADPSLRHGYVVERGDVATAFTPEPWDDRLC